MPYTRICNCLLDYDYVLHIVTFAILYIHSLYITLYITVIHVHILYTSLLCTHNVYITFMVGVGVVPTRKCNVLDISVDYGPLYMTATIFHLFPSRCFTAVKLFFFSNKAYAVLCSGGFRGGKVYRQILIKFKISDPKYTNFAISGGAHPFWSGSPFSNFLADCHCFRYIYSTIRYPLIHVKCVHGNEVQSAQN